MVSSAHAPATVDANAPTETTAAKNILDIACSFCLKTLL
jgi:hypothetical protein